MSYQKKFNLERENLILKKQLSFLNKQNLDLKNSLNKNTEEKDDALKKLDDNNNKYLCNICFTNPKNIILNPCFHFTFCDKCLPKLKDCPVCRQYIECYHYVYN